MLKMYAEEQFYKDGYRMGMDGIIPASAFPYYSMRATGKIRFRTNGNIDESAELSEEVKMCCCEVAEKMYQLDKAKGENGLILQSFSNDGDSGTFKTDDISEKAVETSIDETIRKWLAGTGLLFCGVRK